MFEESKFDNFNISNARRNNQIKQCRIVRFMDGGTIFDGNCTCWCPKECYFKLAKMLPDVAAEDMFSDIKNFYRQLNTE